MIDTCSHDRQDLEEALRYSFSCPELLDRALRHSSWVAETGHGPSNERLEFLGDTVLQMVVTDFIFREYPDYPEGRLVLLRSGVVDNDKTLPEVAREVGVGRHLLLGKGEDLTGGRDRPRNLANAMEAVLGAVYLDGGMGAARCLILRLWEERISSAARQPGPSDYKSRLQELLAPKGMTPEYRITGEEGPPHRPEFTAVVSWKGADRGCGIGPKKKTAEKEAARVALHALAADPEDDG